MRELEVSKEAINKLQETIDRCTRLVNSWPEWKQNILENSAKPTVDIPRKPVCNGDCCE